MAGLTARRSADDIGLLSMTNVNETVTDRDSRGLKRSILGIDGTDQAITGNRSRWGSTAYWQDPVD